MSNFVNMQNSGGIFRSRRLGLRRWFSRTAIVIVIAAGAVTTACEFSQEQTIDLDTFTIPQVTYYEEQAVELPEEVNDPALAFDSARIDYNIESSSNFRFGDRKVTISFYVSSRETANDKNSEPEVDDERVFTVVLEGDDDLGSGSANSAELVDILNSGQDTFVTAIDVESSSLTFVSEAELTVDLEVTVGYTVSVP
ncbi:MAG: hypothetical protein ACOC4F_00335 [bacterium]